MASNPDYYSRARRQGASSYIALQYETYVYAAQRIGVKPLPCNRFLAAIDFWSIESVIALQHESVAARLIYAVTGGTVGGGTADAITGGGTIHGGTVTTFTA